MLRKVLLFGLLLAGCLAGLANTKTMLITQADSSPLMPCDFVARFKIVNRATQITLDDIDFIRKLIWRGVDKDEAIEELRERITTYGPITKIEELIGLEKFDGPRYSQAGENRAFLVRLFYASEGDDICMISSVQTASSILSLGDLWDALDDLGNAMKDLEDDLEDSRTGWRSWKMS